MTTEAARARWIAVRAKRATHEGWAGGTVGAVARDARGTSRRRRAPAAA